MSLELSDVVRQLVITLADDNAANILVDQLIEGTLDTAVRTSFLGLVFLVLLCFPRIIWVTMSGERWED
jgi:hypothetical protein